jgi:hypothetical protein
MTFMIELCTPGRPARQNAKLRLRATQRNDHQDGNWRQRGLSCSRRLRDNFLYFPANKLSRPLEQRRRCSAEGREAGEGSLRQLASAAAPRVIIFSAFPGEKAVERWIWPWVLGGAARRWAAA